MLDKTAKFFDSYAREFDAIYGTKQNLFNKFINEVFRKAMKLRFQLTIEGCKPIENAKILDIGCGPGHYAITLAQKGAGYVLGIDFAPKMIEIARERAKIYNVQNRCEFLVQDFFEFEPKEKFDFTILMGFMDYMSEPVKVIEKVARLTRKKAFFSFPIDKGILAWQRKLRYKKRCPLFVYTMERVRDLFKNFPPDKVEYKKIHRDCFVTLDLE